MIQDKTILAAIVSLLCIGCSGASKTGADGVETIDFYNDCRIVACEALPGEPVEIRLAEPDLAHSLRHIDEVRVIDGAIYVTDSHNREVRILRYDLEGNPTGLFHKQGRGHGEYTVMCDYCFDGDGFLYLVDGNRDVILKYDPDFAFVESIDPGCEIDLLEPLKGGGFLCSLSPWNGGEYAGDELILMNERFERTATLLQYGRPLDQNFLLSGPRFTRAGDRIVYHRSIDDRLHIVDLATGELHTLQLDFGSRTVSDEMRADVFRFWSSGELVGTTTLLDCYAYSDDRLYGILYDDMKHCPFMLDLRRREVMQLPAQNGNPDPVFIRGGGENCVVTYRVSVDPDGEDESTVLCLYRF